MVALLGIVWLSEKPTFLQWRGIILAIIGAVLYFYPVAMPQAQAIGVIVVLAGIIVHAVSLIIGRDINRSSKYHPLVVTVISMGTGAIALLVTALCVEGVPEINFKGGVIIAWLAVVNNSIGIHAHEPYPPHPDSNGVQHDQQHDPDA